MSADDRQSGDLLSNSIIGKLFFFPRLNVTTRLVAGFSIIAGISIAVGIIGLYFIHQIDDNLNRITDVTAPTVEVADDLIANIWQSTKVAEESILVKTPQGLTSLIDEFDGLRIEFDKNYVELRSLLSNQSLLDELLASERKNIEFRKRAHEMFGSRRTELVEQERSDKLLADFNRMSATLIVSLTEFAEENEAELLHAEIESSTEQSSRTKAENNALGQSVIQDYPVVEAALKLQRLVTEIKDTARAFLAAKTTPRLIEAQADFNRLHNELNPQIEILRQFAESEEDKKDVVDLRSVLKNWIAIAQNDDGLFKSHLNKLTATQNTYERAELLEINAENMASALNRVADFADAINDSADEEAAAVVDRARKVIALFLTLAVLVSFLLALMVFGTVAKPIKALARAMVDLGEGDNTSTIDLGKRSDEIGELASTFNDMALKLDKAAKNLEGQVLARTADLNATNQRLEEELTRRQALEDQLVRAQKLDSLGTLAGGVAHDFNNMLYVILGCSEIALKKVTKRNAAYDSLVRIEKAARRSATIVRQILFFSRHEKPDRQPLEISKVTEDSIMLLRAGLPSSLKLDVDTHQDCGLILADETQIHQVIVNFVTNAFHAYENRAGTVSVVTRPAIVDEDFCTQHIGLTPGCYVRVRISDTGCGISSENLPRIFDPFFTTKPVGEGTGLGLSVAHGIVSNHGGVIVLSSTPGDGTTADIYLPTITSEPLAIADQNR
ncbi:MAG TPA: hypothetical protein DCS30_12555 [Rhizobiales bacterium]|nr:hypothetical protein [Hyphomicrobiales bacterium]